MRPWWTLARGILPSTPRMKLTREAHMRRERERTPRTAPLASSDGLCSGTHSTPYEVGGKGPGNARLEPAAAVGIVC
jgi:hypothetical protein